MQIQHFFTKFVESKILDDPNTPLLTRIKIYEFFIVIVKLDVQVMNFQLATKYACLLAQLVSDMQQFKDNSNLLNVIFRLIKSVTWSQSEPALPNKLYNDLQLLTLFDGLFKAPEYDKVAQNRRTDIYAFVHDLISEIYVKTAPS